MSTVLYGGTKNVRKKLRNIVTQVEEGFIIPEYNEVKIRYVKRKEEADFWVTPEHSLSDYIVLGSFALLNSLTERKPEITVYDEPFSKRSTVTLLSDNRRKPILVESDLLLQIVDPIN